MLPESISPGARSCGDQTALKKSKSSEDYIVLNNGRYVRIHTIGKGGFGNVFLAKSLEDGKKVALKITSCYAERELYALRELQKYENVVKLIDFSLIGSTAHFALELADCSVDRLVGLWGVDNTILSQKQLNFFLAEILRVYININEDYLLDYVDLNCRNILYFSRESRLKLTDFGIKHDGKILYKVGSVLYYVLFRMAHGCKATEPNMMTKTFCDSACEHGLRFGVPAPGNTSWQRNADDSFLKLVTKLYRSEFSVDELKYLLKSLENNSDLLPVPKTLQPGKQLSIAGSLSDF